MIDLAAPVLGAQILVANQSQRVVEKAGRRHLGVSPSSPISARQRIDALAATLQAHPLKALPTGFPDEPQIFHTTGRDLRQIPRVTEIKRVKNKTGSGQLSQEAGLYYLRILSCQFALRGDENHEQ
jgi:hypothetical protein